jgi:hypothetical protein
MTLPFGGCIIVSTFGYRIPDVNTVGLGKHGHNVLHIVYFQCRTAFMLLAKESLMYLPRGYRSAPV